MNHHHQHTTTATTTTATCPYRLTTITPKLPLSPIVVHSKLATHHPHDGSDNDDDDHINNGPESALEQQQQQQQREHNWLTAAATSTMSDQPPIALNHSCQHVSILRNHMLFVLNVPHPIPPSSSTLSPSASFASSASFVSSSSSFNVFPVPITHHLLPGEHLTNSMCWLSFPQSPSSPSPSSSSSTSTSKQQSILHFLCVGSSEGYLHIFHHHHHNHGHSSQQQQQQHVRKTTTTTKTNLVLRQFLHEAPIKRIKVQSVAHFSTLAEQQMESLLIVFASIVVRIELRALVSHLRKLISANDDNDNRNSNVDDDDDDDDVGNDKENNDSRQRFTVKKTTWRGDHHAAPFVKYQKCELGDQSVMNDVICVPSPSLSSSSNSVFDMFHSSKPLFHLLTCGTQPMIVRYSVQHYSATMTDGDNGGDHDHNHNHKHGNRGYSGAGGAIDRHVSVSKLTTKYVEKASSAVLSFTKNLWWNSNSGTPNDESDDDEDEDEDDDNGNGGHDKNDNNVNSHHAASKQQLSWSPTLCDMTLDDVKREMISVQLDVSGRLMVTSDKMGRIMIIDAQNFVILKVLKGYRNAQCCFLNYNELTVTLSSSPSSTPSSTPLSPTIDKNNGDGDDDDERQHKQEENDEKLKRKKQRIRSGLALVIYAPKRGLLEMWNVRTLTRMFVENVGYDKLLACAPPIVCQSSHNNNRYGNGSSSTQREHRCDNDSEHGDLFNVERELKFHGTPSVYLVDKTGKIEQLTIPPNVPR